MFEEASQALLGNYLFSTPPVVTAVSGRMHLLITNPETEPKFVHHNMLLPHAGQVGKSEGLSSVLGANVANSTMQSDDDSDPHFSFNFESAKYHPQMFYGNKYLLKKFRAYSVRTKVTCVHVWQYSRMWSQPIRW